MAALTHSGEKTYYWSYEKGHAARTEVQTGVSDGEWIEVTNHQAPLLADRQEPWAPIDGTEQVIMGDVSILSEGGAVKLLREPTARKLASDQPVHPAIAPN